VPGPESQAGRGPKLAASSRRAASNSAADGAATSCSRIGRDLGAVVLLGDHLVEGGLQVSPDRRDGILLIQERERVFQSAT